MLNSTLKDSERYQPGLSIDCVIFGFSDNQLKVLLIKTIYGEKWGLPGGFVSKDEDLDLAANSVLYKRTGLEGIFLRQFATFGAVKRNEGHFDDALFAKLGTPFEDRGWFLQRFITVGYYALVDILKAVPQRKVDTELVEWIDHNAVPDLILDHKEIIDRALETLRMELNLMPIGYNLLPEKFTIPELQRLYETILGKKLDRRNFLRKITSIGILTKLDEKKSNVAHKAPNLYSFDKERYDAVLKSGLNQGW